MRRALLALTLVACARSTSSTASPGAAYDLVITNGTIIDGSGAARFRGDVAVSNGQIVRVERGSIPTDGAKRVIDAKGLLVAPGFIDLHAHLEPITEMPDAQSAAMQGVTLALG